MLSPEAMCVLAALCDAADHTPGSTMPLRRTAVAALGGDWDQALSALAALDAAGYVRAEIIGWIEGWVTERGRAAHRAAAAGK